jgi:hypothetical protein
LGAVELAALPARGSLAPYGRLQPLLYELLAHAGHRRRAGVEDFGDAVVGPAVGGDIGLQQDAGAPDQRRRAGAGGGAVFEFVPLFGGEPHDKLILQRHHDSPR